jgi:glycerate kinase
LHTATVTGPLGSPVNARFLLLPDSVTAVIEAAEAVGLGLVAESARGPARTTTRGVGELMLEASSLGASRIIVGLGGTGTIDGGAGMAAALGVRFDGVPTPLTGGSLSLLRAIDVASRDPCIARTEIIAACDVDNPLCGEDGAAHAYGPQKGATPEDVAVLSAALERLAVVAGRPGSELGDGAAGGLGYGLRVFAGARCTHGIDFVLDAVALDDLLTDTDLVLTGEGRLDGGSARGKVISGVSARCRARGVPVVALVGAVGEGARAVYERGLDAVFSICNRPLSDSEAHARAPELLENVAENVVRLACRT